MLKSYAALIVMCSLLLIALLFSRTFIHKAPVTQDPQQFSGAYALVLKDYAGADVHLYQYRRKVLVVYSWASWCPYCGAELQNLAKEKHSYGDQIDVIAINRAEQMRDAKAYTDRLQNVSDLIFLLDPEDSYFKLIGGYAMPETTFVDQKGDIVFHQRGPIQIQEVDDKIKELLKE